MNNGVLAGFHQNMTQIINELIALIDEEILLYKMISKYEVS